MTFRGMVAAASVVVSGFAISVLTVGAQSADGHVQQRRSSNPSKELPDVPPPRRDAPLIALDLCNVLNSGAVVTDNTIFVPGGPWLQPLTILTPRFFKITAEIEL